MLLFPHIPDSDHMESELAHPGVVKTQAYLDPDYFGFLIPRYRQLKRIVGKYCPLGKRWLHIVTVGAHCIVS